jgi:hypothetical protein
MWRVVLRDDQESRVLEKTYRKALKRTLKRAEDRAGNRQQ